MAYPSCGQGLAHRDQLVPGPGRLETARIEDVAAVPEPGDVGLGLHRVPPALEGVGLDERVDHVGEVVVVQPAGIEVVERAEEPGGGELGDPDRVEQGDVRGSAFGHGVDENVMQILQLDGGDAQRGLRRTGVPHQALPRPFGHDDPELGATPVALDPVWVDEAAVSPLPEDRALLGELGQRSVHRRPADVEAGTQLVLGGKLAVRPVLAAEDLLQQQGLELDIDRQRLVWVDHAGHPGPPAVPPAGGVIVPHRRAVIAGGPVSRDTRIAAATAGPRRGAPDRRHDRPSAAERQRA
jgi:hypothetical protein